MSRLTATALFFAVLAAQGLSAQAQTVAPRDAKPSQAQRAAESIIHCTYHDAGSRRSLQPCAVPRTGEPVRLGSNVTRQEMECILSGVCTTPERGRINS